MTVLTTKFSKFILLNLSKIKDFKLFFKMFTVLNDFIIEKSNLF